MVMAKKWPSKKRGAHMIVELDKPG